MQAINDEIWSKNFKKAYKMLDDIWTHRDDDGYKWSINLNPDSYGYTPLHLLVLRLNDRYDRDPREPRFLNAGFGLGVYESPPRWTNDEYGQKLFLYFLDFEYLNRTT